MLVLSRQANERITITGPGPVTITITEIRGNNVRLGFESPRETVILRSELEPQTLPGPIVREFVGDDGSGAAV